MLNDNDIAGRQYDGEARRRRPARRVKDIGLDRDKVHALFCGKTARGQNNAVRILFCAAVSRFIGRERVSSRPSCPPHLKILDKCVVNSRCCARGRILLKCELTGQGLLSERAAEWELCRFMFAEDDHENSHPQP